MDDQNHAADENVDELELAYLRALEAIEDAEVQVEEALQEIHAAEPDNDAEAQDEPSAARVSQGEASAAIRPDGPLESECDGDSDFNASPAQIIEAAIFVGGESLTTRKLSTLFRGDVSSEFISETIETLNQRYAAEQRPYEIRLGEGGYSMQLRAEFDSLHRKVFGIGPKEVRLSQDALEVLALVAYQQPISRDTVEETGKSNAGNLLRQLVRRQLVSVDRSGGRDNIVYRTTDRFLSVFGIGDTEDLPHPEALTFK